MGAASSVGSVNTTSPEVILLLFAVAVEKGIELMHLV